MFVLRDIKPDEVLVKVEACGVCGHDMIMASYAATEWQPLGMKYRGLLRNRRSGTKCKTR